MNNKNYINFTVNINYQNLRQMKKDPFERYLYSRNLQKKPQVQLQLSDSSPDPEKQSNVKNKSRQLKITELFGNRQKVKNNKQQQLKMGNINIAPAEKQRFEATNPQRKQQGNIFAQPKWADLIREQAKIRAQRKELQQAPIFLKIQKAQRKKEKQRQPQPVINAKNKQLQQQKRLRRQKKKQQQRRKQQQILKKKALTFKNFLHSYDKNHDADKQNRAEKTQKNELNNLDMFNKFEQDNAQKNTSKAGLGLTYKKITVQKQKVPVSFLKMLLSYKFSSQYPKEQGKRVPNEFPDQLTYKKVFHYLIINQCIADIHLRLKKVQETSPNYLSVSIQNFKSNADGFVQFSITENCKQTPKPNSLNQKQKIAIKNFSLSRNRLGLITNAKSFRTEHFGTPCPKNQRIFSFLCILVTPESKQELNSQTKALSNIPIDSLDLILKLNKTNKCYYYDLQKISTHIRQYMAVTYLYDTELASFIYNPKLIESYLQLISQNQRQMLQPILQKLKTEYNTTQYESIRQMALRQSGIVLLQGPPGTGKTTTLMGLLAAQYEYLKNICSYEDKRKILICAPSNAAINHITKRLVCQGLITRSANTSTAFSADGSHYRQETGSQRVFPKVLRIGIVDTDDKDIINVSLDDILDSKVKKKKDKYDRINNMTTTQLKQETIMLSKQINKLRGRKDMQQWQKQSKINSLKYQIQRYDNMIFNSRKERIERKQIYTQMENKLLEEADIILTTLSSSGNDKMEKLRGFIGCLIVDQAAQATQPNILIPLQSGVRKVLLIGDPYQLPSTTMSQDSSITLFNRSLFERFLDNNVKPYFLNIQYRMAPLIRQFPSTVFYNNRLVDAQSVISRYNIKQLQAETQNSQSAQAKSLKSISNFFCRNSIFMDVKFGQEQFHSNSYRNVGQCLVIKSFVLHFIKNTNLSIGIITPYQAQRKYLLRELKVEVQTNQYLRNKLQKYGENQNDRTKIVSAGDNSLITQQNSGVNLQNEMQEGQVNQQLIDEQLINKQDEKCESKPQFKERKGNGAEKQVTVTKSTQENLLERVMINTVDSFQGQQKDIIIVSTVRSNNKCDIGFMKDQRRINVALTRSKHLLIVVGNGDTIGSNQTWNRYLQWSESKSCYYQIQAREGIQQTISQVNRGPNSQKIKRIRHTKFSKDLRRQQREQIGRQDFGLTSKAKKKVKKQRIQNYEYQKKKQLQNKQKERERENIEKIKQNENKMQQQDLKKAEQLIEEKRAREQEAINLEEVNKRIKQLQQKMKLQEDNPYAKLFE